MSDQTVEKHSGLLAALLAFQAQAPTLRKDKSNPGFKGAKYTPLDTIVETVGPILNTNGLVWVTLPVADEHGHPALYYRLAHADSGEEISGTMPLLLSKTDAQGLGSAITYARRYSLCAVLNLVADDDDDGNAASPQGAQRNAAGAGSGVPTGPQITELGRQIKTHRPDNKILRAMLRSVGAKDVTDAQLADGSWSTIVSRQQVSKLLDMFKEGVLPTGESDIPNDYEQAGA